MSTNKTTHTPGPWRIAPSFAEGADHVRVCVGAENIAKVGSSDHSWSQAIADATLIMASPDLLEALQQCLAYIERDEQRHGRQLPEGKAARAAIEKATGEK